MTKSRLFQTESADNHFKFDENGREFSTKLGNDVGKGEIARSEQFTLFPLYFQKISKEDTKKISERVNNQFLDDDLRGVMH